jgi:hypothetical protein
MELKLLLARSDRRLAFSRQRGYGHHCTCDHVAAPLESSDGNEEMPPRRGGSSESDLNVAGWSRAKEKSAVESEMRGAASRKRNLTEAHVRALGGLFLVGLVLAGTASRALAQTGTSGSTLYTFGSTVSQDESNYTLYYSMPQVIHAGVRTNMTFYVYITLLSGWKIQSQTQILQLIINTPGKQVTTLQAQNNVTLYQGGRWGPFNMTVDLNDSQAGLSAGQVTNATVFGNLVVYEASDDPAAPFVQDSGTTLKLNTVQIAATPGGSGPSDDRLFGSLAVGAAVIAVLAAIAVATRKKSET